MVRIAIVQTCRIVQAPSDNSFSLGNAYIRFMRPNLVQMLLE